MHAKFTRFSKSISGYVGSAYAFAAAMAIVLLWFATGPVFGYSDTWQLFINTGTTIVTFLMVFVIQNTQNRDSKAIHLKLDELICAVELARIELVDIEDRSEEELDRLQREFIRKRREGEQKAAQSQ